MDDPVTLEEAGSTLDSWRFGGSRASPPTIARRSAEHGVAARAAHWLACSKREGRRHAQRQAWALAKEAFQAAVEMAPCWSVACGTTLPTSSCRRLGEFDDAERSLLLVRGGVRVRDPDYFASLGHCYLAWSRPAQAEQCYRNALGLQPNTSSPGSGRASRLTRTRGQADAARNSLRQWHAAEPENPDPLIRLGILCKEAERPTEAEQAWLKAIAAQPDNLAGYGNLGQLYAEQGDQG